MMMDDASLTQAALTQAALTQAAILHNMMDDDG